MTAFHWLLVVAVALLVVGSPGAALAVLAFPALAWTCNRIMEARNG